MAIGWIQAFRAVPWSEVIAAAPVVVAGAKKILASLQKKEQTDRSASRADPAAPLPSDPGLRALHQRIAGLEADLVDATQILKSLADQHARLVVAVETLRVRTRALIWTCAVLGVAVAGLALWLWLR